MIKLHSEYCVSLPHLNGAGKLSVIAYSTMNPRRFGWRVQHRTEHFSTEIMGLGRFETVDECLSNANEAGVEVRARVRA